MRRMVIKNKTNRFESEVTRPNRHPLQGHAAQRRFHPDGFRGDRDSRNSLAWTANKATRVMLKVHREGVGVCGVFRRDVAATKVEQVIAYARQHQHPLACVMEEN